MERNLHARFETAAFSHPGTRRENQDAVLAGTAAGIWAVADGMGGHDAGRHASQAAIDALAAIAPQETAALLLRACEAAIVAVNDSLMRRGAAKGATIGTTLVALLAHDLHYACIWAGDSRFYRVRGGSIGQINHDHTEVQDLVDRGLLTEDERRFSPRRNIITRAVGASAEVELEIAQGEIMAKDMFLLCSDGLTNHLDDTDILSILTAHPVQEACRRLIDLALARGGTDNVSAILIRCRGSGHPATGSLAGVLP